MRISLSYAVGIELTVFSSIEVSPVLDRYLTVPIGSVFRLFHYSSLFGIRKSIPPLRS
jgi:hypothetical protein